MQDIRDLAHAVTATIPDALEKFGGIGEIEVMVHAALRSYAVDLLLSLANAIQPSNDAETQAVLWLRDQIVRVAAQIPEAINHKETVTS